MRRHLIKVFALGQPCFIARRADGPLTGLGHCSCCRPSAALRGRLEDFAPEVPRRSGFRRRVWTADWLDTAISSHPSQTHELPLQTDC